MPKKVISLSGIVKQIDQVTKKLAAAEGKSVTGAEKKKLTTIVKNLNKIKKEVTKNCPKGKSSYGIVVLEK